MLTLSPGLKPGDYQCLQTVPRDCNKKYSIYIEIHWKPRVIMMSTLSSLVSKTVVITATVGATHDAKARIIKTQGFRYLHKVLVWFVTLLLDPQYILNGYMWCVYSYLLGILHGYKDNRVMATVPVKWIWNRWVNSINTNHIKTHQIYPCLSTGL